jgi:aspartate kinase
MALIVQKYGGTSMGSIERIKNVAQRVKRWHDNGHQVVVVVSAMSGETNRLIDLARQISKEPNAREYDQMVSTGEQVSISLLAMALNEIGVSAKSMTGGQVAIRTDDSHTKARIQHIDDSQIRAALDAGMVVVVAGFQGVDDKGDINTLGRGGSDTTGVALAAALSADECQIYTDVDGVYTTDPRVTPKAKKLSKITFEEMLEMASLGSKVLQIRSVEFAGKYQVPLRVLSSFDENADGKFDDDFKNNVGTLITTDEGDSMEQPIISGIAFNRDEAKVSILAVADRCCAFERVYCAFVERPRDWLPQNHCGLDLFYHGRQNQLGEYHNPCVHAQFVHAQSVRVEFFDKSLHGVQQCLLAH